MPTDPATPARRYAGLYPAEWLCALAVLVLAVLAFALGQADDRAPPASAPRITAEVALDVDVDTTCRRYGVPKSLCDEAAADGETVSIPLEPDQSR